MAELRFSFRPSEIRLIVGALTAVRARVTFQMNPPPTLDSRDYCIYKFCGEEIDALLTKLSAHGETA